VAAVVFTAGAAIPAIGAIVGTGGLSGAVGGLLSSVGIEASSTLGAVLTGAVTDAGFGSVIGAAGAAITGGNIMKGAETGMMTGAVAGGVGGLLTGGTAASALQAPDIAKEVGTQTVSASAPTIAADGTVGAADGLTGSTVAAATPVTSAALPAATASAGAAGSVPGDLPGFVTPQAPSAALPTFDVANPVTGPGLASNPVTSPALASNPAAGPTSASDGAASGGGLMSYLGKNGPLGNGGLGNVIGGIGQGLLEGQTEADKAKAAMNMQTQQQGYVAGNFGTTGGGLLTPAGQKTGLQTPQQAFNPSSRWVYDPTQKKLVLVPSATS
jgi:hypothetical protein